MPFLTEKAVQILEMGRPRGRPFFMFVLLTRLKMALLLFVKIGETGL
jgi:hypothetical protein